MNASSIASYSVSFTSQKRIDCRYLELPQFVFNLQSPLKKLPPVKELTTSLAVTFLNGNEITYSSLFTSGIDLSIATLPVTVVAF